jgi:hypothetical protein
VLFSEIPRNVFIILYNLIDRFTGYRIVGQK